MKEKILIFLIILGAVLLSGCMNQEQSQKVTGSNQPGMTKEIVLNETMSGRHVTIKEDDTIQIYLNENPTTGYQWNASLTKGLGIRNDTYIPDQVEQGLVGSGGKHYWLISGVEKGEQSFYAIYKRSWEPEKESNQRFSLNITVI